MSSSHQAEQKPLITHKSKKAPSPSYRKTNEIIPKSSILRRSPSSSSTQPIPIPKTKSSSTSYNRANICQTSSSYNITKAVHTINPFSLRYVEGVEPITVVQSTEEGGDLEYQKGGSGIPFYEEEELPASNSYSNPSPLSVVYTRFTVNQYPKSNSLSTESLSSLEEIPSTPVNRESEENTPTSEDYTTECIPSPRQIAQQSRNRQDRHLSRNQNDSPVKTQQYRGSSGAEAKLSLDSKTTGRQSFRRSLPTGLVVSNIAPAFARLKQIVSSVRRSRSSSARMSVSGTKRKSSPPTFSNGSEASGSSTNPGSSSNSNNHDNDANPTKMRRRQLSQPTTTPANHDAAATIDSILSKYFDSPFYPYPDPRDPVNRIGTPGWEPPSRKRQAWERGSRLPPPQSRLRKNRTKDSSVVSVIPWIEIQKKEFELPYKLRVQLDQTPIPHEQQLKHSWNDQDKSLNIVLLPHTNSLVFRRYPVAQSTDCIRGKIGFSSGLHVWHIKWPSNQRGTHAVIGVATKDAPLHCSGYKSLIGSNTESWGWDIGRSKLMHDYTNSPPSPYPSTILDKDEVLVVPEKITVILDMDEGTLAYMVDGQYLGVAFSGLNQANKPLYPIVSAVWGHCEVEMSYIHAPQGSYSYLSSHLLTCLIFRIAHIPLEVDPSALFQVLLLPDLYLDLFCVVPSSP